MNSKAASKWNPISTLLVLRHPAKQPPTCHLILYLLRLKVLTSHPCALHNMADGQLRTAPKAAAAAVDPVYAEKVLLRGHGVLIFHSQSCRRISTSDQVHFTYSADNRQHTAESAEKSVHWSSLCRDGTYGVTVIHTRAVKQFHLNSKLKYETFN